MPSVPRLTLLLLTACTLPLSAASAETRQFANIVYEVPEGWEPNGETEGRVELQYDGDDDRCTDCRVWIDPGASGSEPIREWRVAIGAPGEDMRVVGNPVLRQESIGEWPAEMMLRQIEGDGRAKFQAYFAIALGIMPLPPDAAHRSPRADIDRRACGETPRRRPKSSR